MGDENKKQDAGTAENVVNIDEAKIRRLRERGHTGMLLEEYEKLRLKFFYDQAINKDEAKRLVLLCKYFMQYGPTESFRLSCQYMYEKYMKPYGL